MKFLSTIISLLLLTGVYTGLSAQNKKLKIENVELEIKNNKVHIFYDIKNSNKDFHDVKLNFINEDFYPVLPYALKGDIGDSISPGTNKMIEWDISKDLPALDSEIRPNVIVDGKQSLGFNGAGPEFALASLLIPGLGDYFVADVSDMKFKPYLRTASVYGLITLGVLAKNNRTKDPDKVVPYNTTSQSRFRDDPDLIKDRVYEVGKTNYWLFPADSEFFLGAAAVIWIGDIIWVAARGNVNKKLRNSLPDFSVSQVPGGATFNLSYTF
ncbi:MAG: hypothetical protein ACP5E3_09040 [Bacteroidales bacterium]